MYENTIKQNYVEHVERNVNVSWRKKELVAIIRKSWRDTRSCQDAVGKFGTTLPHSHDLRDEMSRLKTDCEGSDSHEHLPHPTFRRVRVARRQTIRQLPDIDLNFNETVNASNPRAQKYWRATEHEEEVLMPTVAMRGKDTKHQLSLTNLPRAKA